MHENNVSGSVPEQAEMSPEAWLNECLMIGKQEARRVLALGIVPYTLTQDDLASEAQLTIARLFRDTRDGAYLRLSIRNSLRDLIKSSYGYRMVERTFQYDNTDLTPAGSIEPNHLNLNLAWLADVVPPAHIEVIRLIYYEGLTVGETAGVLGIQHQNVVKRLNRAHESIRKIISPETGAKT